MHARRGARRAIGAAAGAAFVMVAAGAGAAERIVAGAVGSPQATSLPYYIAEEKGYLAAAGIALDFVYAASAPGIMQQLTGGSLDIVATTGLVEPLHAADKGAPIVILRVIGQAPPYAMIGRKGLTSLKELKGKTLAFGGLADITSIYGERMLAANGLAPGDYDVIAIGATGARFAALASGAVDGALLLPPFNFHAEAQGFPDLGLVIDYVKDMPFTGIETTRGYGAAHLKELRALVAAFDEAVAWFDDDKNRDAAIGILERHVKTDAADAAASYAFLRRIDFFARGHTLSRRAFGGLIAALQKNGDVGPEMTLDRVAMPGLTALGE